MNETLKTVLRLLTTMSYLVGFSLLVIGTYVIKPAPNSFPWDSVVRLAGGLFFGLGVLLLLLGGRAPVLDERELKLSAKANQWGIVVLFFYILVVWVLADAFPGVITVQVALLGAFATLIAACAIALNILRLLPPKD